jgi:hypothetical protein
MKQILHLVWFDVKALKWWLAAWGAVLTAQVAVYVWSPNPAYTPAGETALSKTWIELLDVSMRYFWLLRIGLAVLIAALVVQRDPLLGTTARWMTLPISRRWLLASKLLTGLFAIILPPTLIAAAAMLLLGLSPVDALHGAWPVAVELATAVLVAFSLAAVTATMTHFLMAAGGGFAFFLLATTAMMTGPAAWWPDASIDVGAWRPVLMAGMPLIFALAVLANQYLTRRIRTSFSIIACAVVLQAGANQVVHGEAAIPPARMVDRALVDPDKVTVTLGLDGLASSTKVRRTGQRDLLVATTTSYVKTAGQPPAVILRPEGIESEMSFGGEAPVRYSVERGNGFRSYDREHGDDNAGRSVEAALGDCVLLRGDPEWGGPGPLVFRLTLTEMPFDAYSRVAAATGTFDAKLTFMALQYRVLGTMPVRPGQSLLSAGERLTVQSVYRTDKPRRGRDSRRIGFRFVSLGDPFFYSWFRGTYFVLRNLSRRQAVYLSPWEDRASLCEVLLGSNGRLSVLTGTLAPRQSSADGQTLFDDEWMKGAELLVVGPEELGTLTRPLHVDNFSLRSATKTWY